MSTSRKYVVAPGQEFNYPDADGLKKILAAGGRSKMTKEQLSEITFKTVTEGADCSDMPASSLAIFLERGLVIDVTPPSKPSKAVIEKEKEVTNG